MTVGTKVHQALASLRSLEGQFETFALDTDDQQVKQMYNQCRQQISQITQQLASRVNYMEQEEPTYKISSSASTGGGVGGNQYNMPGLTGADSMTGAASMTNMTSPLSQTTFGTGRSVGSTASTGATGNSGWSSPTNNTGSNKSTKKKSR